MQSDIKTNDEIYPQDLINEETKLTPTTSYGDIHYIQSTKSKQTPTKFINNIQSMKIASIGNVDSGKSTLIGVLTKGLADDGRGAARKRVFNYPHEQETGRTSSIGHEIMGFDALGSQVLPERFVQNKNKYWADIMQNIQKVITFLDLCGHEKYLKTTLNGLVGMKPDYSMIIVGSNMGISGMTKEHLGISLALKLPFFVVFTKVDICPENVYQENMNKLLWLLKQQHVNRKPIQITEKTQSKEILTMAESMESDRICPIFSVSAVTMQGIVQLKEFLSKLKTRYKDNKNDFLEYDINENFMVPGVGIVVSGVIKAGTAKLNQIVQFGPDKAKQFIPVVIRSIHLNRVQVDVAYSGQCACFAIKPVKASDKLNREDFRKGMLLLDQRIQPNPVWEFEAEIQVLHHPTTISVGYQSVLHCDVMMQAAQIISIKSGNLLRTNDKDIVRFRFMYSPEYLKIGETFLMREGRTKIAGTIARLIEDSEVDEEKAKLEKKEKAKQNVVEVNNKVIAKDVEYVDESK